MVLFRPLDADTNAMASHYGNTNTSSIMWCQWDNTHKSDVAPHFNCLNLREGTVPLMMLLAWYDIHASANGIKKSRGQAAPHFNSLDLRDVMVLFWGPLAANTRPIFAPHFDYLHKTNAVMMHHMMVMQVPMASHDQKSHVHLLLIILT